MIHHTETCRCKQGIEDTSHFLFSCPLYAIPRATLAASVKHILQKNSLNHLANQSDLYLYGHRSLTSVVNRKLLLSTIKYIKDPIFFNLSPPHRDFNIFLKFFPFYICM